MLLHVRYFFTTFHTFSKSIFGLFPLVSNTTQSYSDFKYSYSAIENLKDLKRSKSLSHVAVVQKMQMLNDLSIAAK